MRRFANRITGKQAAQDLARNILVPRNGVYHSGYFIAKLVAKGANADFVFRRRDEIEFLEQLAGRSLPVVN